MIWSLLRHAFVVVAILAVSMELALAKDPLLWSAGVFLAIGYLVWVTVAWAVHRNAGEDPS